MNKVQVIIDNVELPCKLIEFSDGSCTLQVDFSDYESNQFRYMSLTLSPSLSVSKMMSVIQQYNTLAFYVRADERILNVPYMPYGRADRQFEAGMLNLRDEFIKDVMAYFDRIITDDIHSPDHRVTSIPKSDCIRSINLDLSNYDAICLPDKGAASQKEDLMSLGLPFIICNKKRNPVNGWITSYEVVSGDVKGLDILIVDDICDGGKTFEICANSLLDAGAKTVSLYVTHGIFSKGIDIFDGVIHSIHYKHLVGGYISRDQILYFNEASK